MGSLLSVDGVILTDDQKKRRTSQLSFGLSSTKRTMLKNKIVYECSQEEMEAPEKWRMKREP